MTKKKKQLQSAIVGVAMFASIAAAPFGVINSEKVAAADTDNYAKLLQYSMYFYDANMCGTGVNDNSQLNWRKNCHTSDEVDFGFHDAGDHVKFGLPQGYSASTLGWGYYEFKDAYDSLGLTSHYKTISDYFCKFFKASTKLSGDTVTSFCYQVGDGDADHNEWCAPEDQTSSRKSLWTDSEGSDIASEYAAALALNYINFGNDEDLKYAKALYAYAKKVNKVASTGIGSFYTSSNFDDDLAWASGWLYLATGEQSYATDCENYQTQYLGYVHCWNNVSVGAACVYSHITGDWSKVNEWINSQITSDNYWFLNQWGSARYNAAMQLCALAASKNSSADYTSWCQKQMAYLLGDNSNNQSFVVGYNSNSPKNPHHRAASGYTSYEDMDKSTVVSPTKSHVLVGALVGGPTDANGTYNDSLQDYTANEVALDYNAGLVGAAAGLYSVYKTGSTDSSIEGVGAVTTDSPAVTTVPVVTTAPQVTTTVGSGTYSIKPDQNVVYSQLPEDDKMIGWEWSKFGIPANEKITKVEIEIETSKDKIGKWQGAFGSSTTVSPEYWTQTSDMEQTISGKSGTLTWNIDSATSGIIQRAYGGELKFGTWWIDCDSFTIKEIKVYTGDASSSSTTTTTKTPAVTTVTTTKTPSSTTAPSSSNGSYTFNANQSVDYNSLPEDDKMIGWEWSKFGIPANEKITKVEINISTTKDKIGKWQGAFGSSTTVSPEYWTQTSDMEQTISGKSGTITWNVDSATSDIIQRNYGGELKFGIWWIDCGTFNIDSIKVYTNGSSTPAVTTTTTKTPAVTTVTTTKTPSSTTAPSSSNGSYTFNANQSVDYNSLPEDDKMIGWEWSKFGIPANEKITKVEINISTTKDKIGKWQGAFGSSTTVSPEYWTQTSDMEQTISGKSGTITWNVDSATSDIIQRNYGGELKFGIWWIDCGTFNIDSIKVYTNGSSTPAVTTTTTKTPAVTTVTTTKTPSSTTTKTPSVTTITPSSSIDTNVKATLLGDVNKDGVVDVVDATALKQYIVRLIDLDSQSLANANVVQDSSVDVKDLGQLLKYIIKVITSF